MSGEPQVRCLGAGEETVLERVAEGVFDHPVQPAWARAYLAEARQLLVVAVVGDVVVAMASGVAYGHPDKAPQLFVNEVGVAPAHRRRGLGSRVLRCLLERGRDLGCVEAWVATEDDNDAALALYTATGGRDEGYRAAVFTYALAPEAGGESVAADGAGDLADPSGRDDPGGPATSGPRP